MPCAPNGACCPRVNGNARWANWPPKPVKLSVSDVCAARAEATVLRRIVGATAWRVDHGRMTGCCTRALARSPSTITPSIGPASLAARRIAPAVPWLPLVEASTTLRCSVSPSRFRASSISVAVPEAAAMAGAPSASREATITMLPLCIPGRTPTTFSSGTVPSTVRPWNVSTVVSKWYWFSVEETWVASESSPADPGRRDGSPWAIDDMVKATFWPLKASGARVGLSAGLLILERERQNNQSQRRNDQPGPVDARIQHRA